MGNQRPAIPMEQKRRVLVEAGHRCAIPTCRHIDVDIHHIVPWETRRSHEYPNLIALCPNCHRRADRDDIDRKALHIYKSNLRLAHDKYSQFEIDTLFSLASNNAGRMPFPSYLFLLIKRLVDSRFVNLQEPESTLRVQGVLVNPGFLSITDAGRAFLRSLDQEQL